MLLFATKNETPNETTLLVNENARVTDPLQSNNDIMQAGYGGAVGGYIGAAIGSVCARSYAGFALGSSGGVILGWFAPTAYRFFKAKILGNTESLASVTISPPSPVITVDMPQITP